MPRWFFVSVVSLWTPKQKCCQNVDLVLLDSRNSFPYWTLLTFQNLLRFQNLSGEAQNFFIYWHNIAIVINQQVVRFFNYILQTTYNNSSLSLGQRQRKFCWMLMSTFLGLIISGIQMHLFVHTNKQTNKKEKMVQWANCLKLQKKSLKPNT